MDPGPWALALALAGLFPGLPARADGPAPWLAFHADRGDPAFGSVDLLGLPAETLARLEGDPPSRDRLRSGFRIVVASPGLADAEIAAVSGRYDVLADRVRFTPSFPPEPGAPYRAMADLSGLLAAPGPRPAPLTFSLAKPVGAPTTHVERIYPSGDTAPANLLRLYIVFSGPMQRGHALDQIRLLDRDGRPDPAAFYRSPVELWDPSMRRLTLLLDPGRVKRGVGPNRAIGAPLRRGERYSLVIGRGMRDAAGQPLRAAYSKTFAVSAPVRTAIDPGQWRVHSPAAGGRAALSLSFPIALDWALAARDIQVVGPDGRAAPGRVTIDRHEHRWSIQPDAPWSAGAYAVRLGETLEDVSGNRIDAPFDRDGPGADPANSARARFLPVDIAAARGARDDHTQRAKAPSGRAEP